MRILRSDIIPITICSYHFQCPAAHTKLWKRNIIIDGSVLGMGRGAGNLCSEILTQYINENIDYRYHTEMLLELMDEYISPISYIHPWGYSAGYFLAATNNCHPNYVGFLLNKQTLNMKQIYQVLKEIPSDERSLYNEKLIAGLYLKFHKMRLMIKIRSRNYKN